jgi:23S rRNA (adenine2503-C2)-methyltransferase
MEKTGLCGLSPEEISAFTESPHAARIAISIYKKHIGSFAEISNISGKLRSRLEASAYPGIFPPYASEKSSDGTVKYLFAAGDGRKFETVFIPESTRNTVCVSSQSGCRMGCPFCVTGRYGFHGNLSAGEIVNQVISLPQAEMIDHVVFMGMGEPMDNIENVLKACNILTAEWGCSISPRNITVSSVGITPVIRHYLAESECNLTVSLFSPFTEERRKMIPVENKYPVGEIIGIMKAFPLRKKRRLSLSYMMISGVNDSENHLEALKDLLRQTSIRVNLLPYHPSPGDSNKSSTSGRMQYFKHSLVTSGISASIRKSRGSDVSAACGLLASGL